MAREGARLLIGYFDEPGGRTAAIEGAAERLATDYLPLDLTNKSRLTCLSSSSSIAAPQPACSAGRVLPPETSCCADEVCTLVSGAMNELLRCYAIGECEVLLTA